MNLSDDPGFDALLASVLQDGAAARAQAEALAGDSALPVPQRAFAHLVCALVEFREGTVAAGLGRLSAAEALAGATPPPRLAGLAAHARALALRREGRLAEAGERLAALHAHAAERPDGDAYLTAAALGIVESMLGDDDGALDRLYQALLLARRSGVPAYLANALSNLGSFEADLYNLDDAAPMLEESLAVALSLGSRRQRIFAAGNLVQCLVLQGESERALAVAEQHLMPVIRADDPPDLRRDDEIAAALLANDRVDEAEPLLAHEVYAGPLTNELRTARVVLLARVRLARGDPDAALALCLQRCATLAAGTGDEITPPADRVELLRTAAEAAARCGRFEQAHALLQEAFELHEALLGRAARSRRLSLQISHRLRAAEWERDSARQIAAALESLNAQLRAEAEENERLKRQLMAHALEDPLTGLHNRRHLFDAGPRLLAAQRRRGGTVAAALIDLDFFKQVNDRHGHAAGDAVLRRFGALLRQETRAGDLACRHGGEEFVLLMADAEATGAAQRLRALLAVFRALRFDGADGSFEASFSAGTATWSGGDEPLEALLRRADAALYAAKAAGRARVLPAE